VGELHNLNWLRRRLRRQNNFPESENKGAENARAPLHVAVWFFFIGLLLTIYGIIILITSIASTGPSLRGESPQLSSQPFGAASFFTLIGSFYVLKFRPRACPGTATSRASR